MPQQGFRAFKERCFPLNITHSQITLMLEVRSDKVQLPGVDVRR